MTANKAEYVVREIAPPLQYNQFEGMLTLANCTMVPIGSPPCELDNEDPVKAGTRLFVARLFIVQVLL
jgi:hypothetical protein